MTQPPTSGPTGPTELPPTSPPAPTSPPPPGYPQTGYPPPGYPPTGYPPHAAPAGRPPRKRGALLAALALAVVLVLCAGGGVAAFLTVRNAESGEGASEPSVAVDEFLTAIYQERDAAKAARLVCSSARDQQKIRAKVAEVEEYLSAHQSPRFRWDTPKVDNETGDRATVTTTVTVTTADEKIANQDLRFTVIRKTGWWVCEVA
ncbi:Rv0361 family membrane protein [Micromonospora gifhornensis]|uniref:Rv0361 family membrane protein n=1 Tax=Micromonospora gifhornensis TaxID=84594 RepID=UPI00365ABF88